MHIGYFGEHVNISFKVYIARDTAIILHCNGRSVLLKFPDNIGNVQITILFELPENEADSKAYGMQCTKRHDFQRHRRRKGTIMQSRALPQFPESQSLFSELVPSDSEPDEYSYRK